MSRERRAWSRRKPWLVAVALLSALTLSSWLLSAQSSPSPQAADAPVAPAAPSAEEPVAGAPAAPAARSAEELAAESGEGEAGAKQSVEEAPDEPELSPEQQAFRADIQHLGVTHHRLAGTKRGQQAAAYLEQRLRGMGIREVYPLDMPVWQTKTSECSLTVQGTTLPLLPLRPNIIVPPVTPPEGVTASLVYVGRGESHEYGDRDVEGAIVIMDYDSADAWHRAFALGARAVVFVGDALKAPVQPKYAGVPTNQLRFYLPRQISTGLDLESGSLEGTLKSRVVWEQRVGRNLLARIPGTDPGFAPDRQEPEAFVLAAHYDSFGVVPELSPGARGAANVAALLEATASLKHDPPKRDLWVMLLDNEARYHEGARELYDAIMMSDEQHRGLVESHRGEEQHVAAMQRVLKDNGLLIPEGAAPSLVSIGLDRALAHVANYIRDDTRKVVELARLRAAARGGELPPDEEGRLSRFSAQALRWDEIRRALHKDVLADFIHEQRRRVEAGGEGAEEAERYVGIFEELRVETLKRFARRLAELGRVIEIDEQRAALRSGLRGGKDARPMPWVVLHATFNFSGEGARWGAVAGDWTNRLFPWRQPKSESDNSGYYGRVLSVLRDVSEAAGGFERLDLDTLGDPGLGLTFAAAPFVSSGTIAGSYGIYNLALMSGYDSRSRDGHPADTLDKLSWQQLRVQALEATGLMRAVADSAGISLPSVIKSMAESKYPLFSDGQISGDYVGLQVSGSLKEDRPAAGAVLAMWPGNRGWKTQAWQSLQDALKLPAFEPIELEPVDETGRFRVIGLREDMHSELMSLGTLSDEQGRVRAISTQEKKAQKLSESMRVNLFVGSAIDWTSRSLSTPNPALLKVLRAASNSPFRDNRGLWGALGDDGFAYVSENVVGYRLKIFEPLGVAVLGQFTESSPYGTGIDPALFGPGVRLSEHTAKDLWALNERRLRQLRERGVTSADLELLHSRSRRALEQAQASKSVAKREASLARSSSLSQHVYLPLRTAMDDLVHSIVLLLLLAIPFAFAMERLTICATTIYGRIGGFTSAFLLTFGLLYWLHPGFAIAATPAIIFLAFAIVLLSSLVIYIVVRKFKTELKAMQGQSFGVHGLEVSRMGTLLAAVGMGMSTMRRRRARTTLTAVTVVMLTFTILAFASFSRTVGVRSLYEGPLNERTRERLLMRKLDYSAIEPATLDLLRGQEGEGGQIVPHYWLLRDGADSERFSVTHPQTGESLTIDGVMGVPPEELDRWPEFAEGLGRTDAAQKIAALKRGEVFLPSIVKQVFKLQSGDQVLLNGRRVTFAGSLSSSALERLKHLDGQSIMPVDFQSALSQATGAQQSSGTDAGESQLLLQDEAERDFIHLGSDQVVVASADLVRRLGGELHAVTIYPGPAVESIERGHRLAELLVMPVWAAGPDGVERLIFTVLTEVSGGLALFVPLLLGGLIIFGTLLGSISDREREIYTFSALGLSPGHVGALFFAEAAVYAVVGGMGGQLLAQLVALGAGELARAGLIQPTSINYSSTNSLFAIGIVMLTVLVSAIYPATRASKSANPGLARSWKMPPAEGDELRLIFPFTVSAYDITGVMSFLAEHFRHHADAGLGDFAASKVEVRKTGEGHLVLAAELALAPFDLGVTQRMELTATPSEIEGVDEVAIFVERLSGTRGDWYRANHVFVRNLRRQFLLWRTLTNEMIEHYRMQTLQSLNRPTVETEEAS